MSERASRSGRSQKHRVILEAATAVFRDDGYDATSMDRIAEVARVSKRTIYNHFGSKEALFRAVVEQLVARAEALKRVEWDPERSLEAQLAEFARAKTKLADDPVWSGLIKVILGVLIRHPEMARETAFRATDNEDALVRWLQAAHDAKKMHVPDPICAARVFWAMVTGALFWPQVLGLPVESCDREQVTRELIATFLCRYGVGGG